MLQFCNLSNKPGVKRNLQHLFGINIVPRDTAMREILDPIATHEFQKIFKPLFSVAQRGKVLENTLILMINTFLALMGQVVFLLPKSIVTIVVKASSDAA